MVDHDSASFPLYSFCLIKKNKQIRNQTLIYTYQMIVVEMSVSPFMSIIT